MRGVKEPGAEKPRARPPEPPESLWCEEGPTFEGTVRGTVPIPIAERGGGIEGGSWLSRFLGFGRRGGTRRLKFATTSGGEWRLRVGWASCRQSHGWKEWDRVLTPSTRVGIVNCGIDVPQVNLAQETIDLKYIRGERRKVEHEKTNI